MPQLSPGLRLQSLDGQVVASSAGEVYILWRRGSGGKIIRTEERREGKRPMKFAHVEQQTARIFIKRTFGVLRIAVLILVAIGVVGSLVFEKGVSLSSLSGAWRVFSLVSTNVTFAFVWLEEIVDAVTNLVTLAATLPIALVFAIVGLARRKKSS